MTDICIALDQSVSPHTGVRNWCAILVCGELFVRDLSNASCPLPFLNRGSAVITLITQYRQLRRLTLACVQTSLQAMIVQKIEWVHFHPVGSQCIKSNLIKILLITN